MIITLDFDPQAVPQVHLETLEAAFIKLIEANFRGWHLTILSRKICDWALETLNLPRIYASHLKSIKEKYATIGGIVNSAEIYLSIEVGTGILATQNNQKFTIGHLNLLNSQYCDSPGKLILEDAPNDGDFYDFVFKTLKSSATVPDYRCDIVHGGGNRTSEVFESNVTDRNISVCIVDSDKKSPLCLPSATAQQSVAKENEFATVLAKVFVTPVREIENFVPLEIYSQVPCNQQFVQELRPIQQILVNETSYPSFWHFVDVKDGINGDAVCQKNARGEISNAALQWIKNKVEIHFQSINEASVRGFGDKALPNCLNHAPTRKLLHRLFRSNEWKSMFGSFFKRIIWYFCSSPRHSFT